MKLILLGFLALACAMPDGLDKPCRPGEHCPRKRPLPRQSTNATCGIHSPVSMKIIQNSIDIADNL